MQKMIDINSDLGEGFGPYRIADDETLLSIVSSANIACGFHAGDPVIMDETVRIAMRNGVDIGAHVGFADRMGFGRRAIPMGSRELETSVLYQLGALEAIAAAQGGKVGHVSAHGALGNMSLADADLAASLIRAYKAFDPEMIVVTLPNTEAERAARVAGMRVACLFLADRAYDDAGKLVARSVDGSVIADPEEITRRVTQAIVEGTIDTISGKTIHTRAHSILVHSDTPRAVDIGRSIRAAVEAAGFAVAGLSQRRLREGNDRSYAQ
ncbi:LamB/YcsF family protein [Nitratireductor indicus C115]|uniref:LamB/YcsF family protein n=1 Tax=Nitratireductor indicus C115 TaxID=1231190 RepID=K2NUB6_9HYPH|nr:5-oxoprolinase subunit PxpA [Nitratireductor indicus]EKF41454.1 LamB/YcsF family protein [Nitratireductor indicus C115]SFQ71695.1 UPF0271 protein [Nitratireductor indicus]